jgi:uncharacterized protein YjbJ (UPF0337 family)
MVHEVLGLTNKPITDWREIMKSSTRDNAEGLLHQAKGAAKEAVGNATGDTALKSEGKAENVAGKVQQKVGDIKKVVNK